MAKCQSCCGPIRWRNVCQTSKHLARAEAFATALHVLQVPEMQKLVWETMANLVATFEGSEFMIAQDLEFLATESQHAWSAIDLRPCLAFLDKLVGSPARQANSSKVLELFLPAGLISERAPQVIQSAPSDVARNVVFHPSPWRDSWSHRRKSTSQ